MDRLVRFYRRLSTTARSVIVFVLAVSVALATMHALTFSATAITKKTGEEDPGIVLNQDPENEDFDNVSEGTGTDNPEEKPSEPASNWAVPPFYLYQRETLPLIVNAVKQSVCNTDAPGDFIAWFCSQRPVHAWKMSGKRYDIGDIRSYEEVQKIFQRK